MKLTYCLAAVLLETSFAAASSIPKNEARQLGLGDCGAGFVLGPGHTPPSNFNFITFCSTYLQETKTKTATVTSTTIRTVTQTKVPAPAVTTTTKFTTVSRTSAVTVTTIYSTTVVVTYRPTSKPTTTTTSTSKSTTSPTTTSPGTPSGTLCPVAGTTPETCGVTGWGYAENNIYYAPGTAAADCHQLCLANADCASFQVQDDTVSAPECNLYKVAIAPNTIIEGDSPFIFYDRNCPDYSPPTCNKRDALPMPMPTAAPNLVDAAPLVKKDDLAATLPPFLVGVDPFLIQAVCQCIFPLGVAPTTTTITKTALVTRTNTATAYGPTTTSSVTVTAGVTQVITATTIVSLSTTVTRTTTAGA